MNIVALTGAGISRESGLLTFRDTDGLWAGYRIEDVCTPEAWRTQPEAVLDFYNMRRREVIAAQPNAAHLALAKLEAHLESTGKGTLSIITQNVDDLHERAGSKRVHHLHGEVLKIRSEYDFDLVQETREDVHLGDLAPDGAQLRPHICFFHETPYDWDLAQQAAEEADIFLVIGTSLSVYPAAGLVDITSASELVFIDPHPPRVHGIRKPIEVIAETAGVGVPEWTERFFEKMSSLNVFND